MSNAIMYADPETLAKLNDEMVEITEAMSEEGATDEEIAAALFAHVAKFKTRTLH